MSFPNTFEAIKATIEALETMLEDNQMMIDSEDIPIQFAKQNGKQETLSISLSFIRGIEEAFMEEYNTILESAAKPDPTSNISNPRPRHRNRKRKTS